ncbi:hypothetical protein NL676_004455 [Syzygium grande]|nr:hypothetical protein NL676_004455 [Syzygium grande]
MADREETLAHVIDPMCGLHDATVCDRVLRDETKFPSWIAHIPLPMDGASLDARRCKPHIELQLGEALVPVTEDRRSVGGLARHEQVGRPPAGGNEWIGGKVLRSNHRRAQRSAPGVLPVGSALRFPAGQNRNDTPYKKEFVKSAGVEPAGDLSSNRSDRTATARVF